MPHHRARFTARGRKAFCVALLTPRDPHPRRLSELSKSTVWKQARLAARDLSRPDLAVLRGSRVAELHHMPP